MRSGSWSFEKPARAPGLTCRRNYCRPCVRFYFNESRFQLRSIGVQMQARTGGFRRTAPVMPLPADAAQQVRTCRTQARPDGFEPSTCGLGNRCAILYATGAVDLEQGTTEQPPNKPRSCGSVEQIRSGKTNPCCHGSTSSAVRKSRVEGSRESPGGQRMQPSRDRAVQSV